MPHRHPTPGVPYNLADAFMSAGVLLPRGARITMDGAGIEFDHYPPTPQELDQVRRWLAVTMPRLPLDRSVRYFDSATGRWAWRPL